MKEPIIKVVASPPQLFWAPFMLALMNMCLQVAMFSMVMAITVVNPLWLLFTILIAHFMLATISKRDQHLTTILQSTGPFLKKTKNIYKVRGNKLGS
jgi:type IV secretory pathway VirB3-like protein